MSRVLALLGLLASFVVATPALAQPQPQVVITAPTSGATLSGPNVTPSAAAPKAVPYDCFGLAGVALRSCIDLNSAAANASDNTPSGSHDCGGMTGAALATCRELNGEIVAPPMNTDRKSVV